MGVSTATATLALKNRLLGFEHYGPAQPAIAFIGLEEHLDSDTQYQNIWTRATHDVFALARADRRLTHEVLMPSALTPGVVKTWTVMSMILAEMRGSDWRKEYQLLGTFESDTYVTELHALPRPGFGAWRDTYIPKLFPEFRSKATYERAARQTAQHRLRQVFRSEHAPRLAFCYGRLREDWFRAIFDVDVAWRSVMANAVIGRTRQGSITVLTGFYEGQAPDAFRRRHVPELVQHIRVTESGAR